MRRILQEVWGFVFWTHDRGGLRYDIMVGLVLAFIFLTPRTFFRDRPSPPSDQQIVILEEGTYRLDASLLAREKHNLEDAARRLLETRTGKHVEVERLEPVLDDDGHLTAYEVWVKP